MSSVFEKALPEASIRALSGLGLDGFSPDGARRDREVGCSHCGEPCPDNAPRSGTKSFCCQGCLTVHEILTASGLDRFYDLADRPGVRIGEQARTDKWAFLDTPAVQQALLDFSDGVQNRITLRVPSIHCVACVWLLENLFRLHEGIGESRVNFPRRELSLRFQPGKITLSRLVGLLASIGYEPEFAFGEARNEKAMRESRRRWLQLGVAGFAFGNIMLFSIPLYLGMDSFSGPGFRAMFGYLSLALALPVLVYSALDYWKGALLSVRQRMLTLDVPIALGLAALYLQSAVEIVSGRGGGYLDSLAGLIFFLLCGKAFQQKTFERLAFDRDYKSFFPLAAVRKTNAGEESVGLSELKTGDRLIIRHGELIPADSRLTAGEGLIDYSFVTGESEPVAKVRGDLLYAGGKQTGGIIEVDLTKGVSQSYLASLWDHKAFRKPRQDELNTLTNAYSRRFTRLVIGIALGACLFWTLMGAAERGLKAFTSVLIVACPCALALAAPFALGTVQRLLARLKVFLKNPLIIERLARVDTIVFDKTGTLTSQDQEVSFIAAKQGPTGISPTERSYVAALAAQSTHPHSLRIRDSLSQPDAVMPPVAGFRETAGSGIAGQINGLRLRLGSAAWLGLNTTEVPNGAGFGSVSHLKINGTYRGAFVIRNSVRPEINCVIKQLAGSYNLALLSGDNERERDTFRQILGPKARLHFNQSPFEKLEFVRELQNQGRTVLMVGDGLNDAGALKQSDVGIAVVQKLGVFSPASDVILEADRVADLEKLLAVSRKSARMVRWSFLISALYNLIGITIAAAGILSPLICAVLMPLSSASVVVFACGAAGRVVRRFDFSGKEAAPCMS